GGGLGWGGGAAGGAAPRVGGGRPRLLRFGRASLAVERGGDAEVGAAATRLTRQRLTIGLLGGGVIAERERDVAPSLDDRARIGRRLGVEQRRFAIRRLAIEVVALPAIPGARCDRRLQLLRGDGDRLLRRGDAG